MLTAYGVTNGQTFASVARDGIPRRSAALRQAACVLPRRTPTTYHYGCHYRSCVHSLAVLHYAFIRLLPPQAVFWSDHTVPLLLGSWFLLLHTTHLPGYMPLPLGFSHMPRTWDRSHCDHLPHAPPHPTRPTLTLTPTPPIPTCTDMRACTSYAFCLLCILSTLPLAACRGFTDACIPASHNAVV